MRARSGLVRSDIGTAAPVVDRVDPSAGRAALAGRRGAAAGRGARSLYTVYLLYERIYFAFTVNTV